MHFCVWDWYQIALTLWFHYFFSALGSSIIIVLTFNRLSATVYLLWNKKCTSQYLKKSSPQIGECVSIPVITPYNPVSGQWSHCLDFLTFIFCEFGHRRLILVILVSGVNLIAWFSLCAQDSMWMNHILHMSKWQKYSWFPGRGRGLLSFFQRVKRFMFNF